MEGPESCGAIAAGISAVRSPHDWREEEVRSFLTAIGLSDLAVVFEKHEVTGSVLLSLTEDDLERQLGVTKFGPRRRLGLAIAELQRLGGQCRAGSGDVAPSVVTTPRQRVHAHGPMQARPSQGPQSCTASFVPQRQSSGPALNRQATPVTTVLAPVAHASGSFVLPAAQASTLVLNPFKTGPLASPRTFGLSLQSTTTAEKASCAALSTPSLPENTKIAVPVQQYQENVSRPRSLGPVYSRRALSPNGRITCSSVFATSPRVRTSSPQRDKAGTPSQNSIAQSTTWSTIPRPTSPAQPCAAFEPVAALGSLSPMRGGALQSHWQVRVPERQVSAPVNTLHAQFPAKSSKIHTSGTTSVATFASAAALAPRVVITPPRHRVTLNGAPVSSNSAPDVAVHERNSFAPQQRSTAAEPESPLMRSWGPATVSTSEGCVTQVEPQAFTTSLKSAATSAAATNEAGAGIGVADLDVAPTETASSAVLACAQTLQPQQRPPLQRQQPQHRQPQQHFAAGRPNRSIGQSDASPASQPVLTCETENVSLGAPTPPWEQTATSSVGDAFQERNLADTLRKVFNSCSPCDHRGGVASAELVAACRQQLRAANHKCPRSARDGSWDAVEWTLQELDSAGSREISWDDFWGAIVALRSVPPATQPPTSTDSTSLALAGPGALASSMTEVTGTGEALACQNRGGWSLGSWTERQAARHKIARHWVVSRALTTGVAGQQQQHIQVRDGAQLRVLAREVDTDILAVTARELNLPGSEGLDNEVSMPESPTELEIAMSAARLPLVKPYVEQLLQDALADLASRASGEGVLRVKDPVQADGAVRAYVRQLSEALLLRLRGIASEGGADTSSLSVGASSVAGESSGSYPTGISRRGAPRRS